MNSALARSVLILLFAALLVPASIPVARADYRVDCNPETEARQVVILVHGYRSSGTAWDGSVDRLTAGGTDTCIARFNYDAANKDVEWVTHPGITPALARQIALYAEASRVGGGTGEVVLVAHSMGGLATRCVLDSECAGGAEVADLVTEVITYGTPNEGSFLRYVGAQEDVQLLGMLVEGACRGAAWVVTPIEGLCEEIGTFTSSAAVRAFTPGSAELEALPEMPEELPVYAMAGRIEFGTSLFGRDIVLGSVGDGVVGEQSALTQQHAVGSLGGQEVVNCGRWIVGGPRDTARRGVAAPTCWHGSQTTDDGFIGPTRAQIERVIAEAEDARNMGGGISGTWSGLVQQSGSQLYGSVLTISDSEVEVSYPGLECSGTWVPTDTENHTGTGFEERITSDPRGTCVARVDIIATPTDDGRLRVQYWDDFAAYLSPGSEIPDLTTSLDPSAVVGTWSGTGSSSASGSFPITVTLNSDSDGLSGTLEYGGLECTSTLTERFRTEITVVMREDLTRNDLGICFDGEVTLTMDTEGRIALDGEDFWWWATPERAF